MIQNLFYDTFEKYSNQNVHLCPSVMAACLAAMCPGAPMTPPPGWAPLPQRRRPDTAVAGLGGWSALGRVR